MFERCENQTRKNKTIHEKIQHKEFLTPKEKEYCDGE